MSLIGILLIILILVGLFNIVKRLTRRKPSESLKLYEESVIKTRQEPDPISVDERSPEGNELMP